MGRPRLKRYQVEVWYNAAFPYLVTAKDPADAQRRALETFKRDRSVKKFLQLDVEEIKPDDERYW